jgi:hypothetical protein
LWSCANPNITLGTNAAYFMSAGGQPVATSSATNSYRIVCPTAGVLKNLYVNLGTAPGAGTSRTCTLYKAGSATAITCVISNTSTSASDTTHTVTIAAGDTLEFDFTLSGSPASTTFSIGMTFTSTNRGEVPSIGAAVSYAINATDYSGLNGALQNSNTETQVTCASGLYAIKNFYALTSGVPGQALVITARKSKADAFNGAATTMTATIGAAATTANSTVGPITATRPDVYGTKIVTPAGANTVQLSISYTLLVFQKLWCTVAQFAEPVTFVRFQRSGIERTIDVVDFGMPHVMFLMRGWSATLGAHQEWWAEYVDTGALMYRGDGAPLTDIVILDVR